MLTLPQIATLIVTSLAYVLAGAMATLGRRRNSQSLTALAKAAGLLGLLLSLGFFAWLSLQREGPWQPLGDNVTALVAMSILIAAFLLYIQFRHPIGSIELFLVPVIVALLLLAGFFGQLVPQQYATTGWSIVHRLTSFLGAAAFAIAAATGALYLRADRALRSKRLDAGPTTSLERLSSLNYSAVTLGFALFTIGCLAGVVWLHHIHETARPGLLAAGKIQFAVAAWIVYAIVLHSPITPRLRGRRNAWLSIIGFLLLLLSIVAVVAMPGEVR